MTRTVLCNPGGTIRRVASNGALAAGGLAIWTAETDFEYELEAVVMDIVCTATVGNRNFMVWLQDGGTIYWFGALSANVTAGQTCGYDISFGNEGTPSTTVRRNIANTASTNVQVRELCPIRSAGDGVVLVVDDINNVDATDAVTYRVVARKYTGP